MTTNVFIQQLPPGAENAYRAALPFHYLYDDLHPYCVYLTSGYTVPVPNPFDVLYLHRALTPTGYDWARGEQDKGRRIIINVDDDLWNLPDWSPAYGAYGAADLDRMVDLADCVCVSTEPLLRYTKGKGRICPNLIEPWRYGKLAGATRYRARHPHKIRVVWAGSSFHAGDLVQLEDALPRVIEKYGDRVEFHFFGHCPRSLMGLVQYHSPVTYAEYPAALSAIRGHIGLAPLERNTFNESKSNIKWLEYSSCRMATIASPVGPYQCIRDGVDGLLATDWVEAVSRLVEDEKLRNRLVRAAAHRVRSEFGWDVLANRWPWADLFAKA